MGATEAELFWRGCYGLTYGATVAELDIRHLRVIRAVVDSGSISKAATRLGVSQPALSAQVRRIEQAFGSPLFSRLADGTVPTEFGRLVSDRATALLGDLDHLLAMCRVQPADALVLRVGTRPTLFTGRLTQALRSELECPDLRLETNSSSALLVEMVRAGRLDLALVEVTQDTAVSTVPGVRTRRLVTEPLFAAVPTTSPLARLSAIPLTALADFEWVTLPPEFDAARTQWGTACAAAGFLPRIRHVVSDGLAVRSLVKCGAVAAVSPHSESTGSVTVLPFVGDPLLVELHVVIHSQGVLAGRDNEVFRCIAAMYRESVDSIPNYRSWWSRNRWAHSEIDRALAESNARTG